MLPPLEDDSPNEATWNPIKRHRVFMFGSVPLEKADFTVYLSVLKGRRVAHMPQLAEPVESTYGTR